MSSVQRFSGPSENFSRAGQRAATDNVLTVPLDFTMDNLHFILCQYAWWNLKRSTKSAQFCLGHHQNLITSQFDLISGVYSYHCIKSRTLLPSSKTWSMQQFFHGRDDQCSWYEDYMFKVVQATDNRNHDKQTQHNTDGQKPLAVIFSICLVMLKFSQEI